MVSPDETSRRVIRDADPGRPLGPAGGPDDLVTLDETSRQVIRDAQTRARIRANLDWQMLVREARLDLLEIGAPEDSTLSTEIRNRGGSAFSVGPHCGIDFSTTAGLRAVLRIVEERRPRHLWFSLPCDPWSTLQYLNQKPEQRQALEARRKRSRRMMRHEEIVLHKAIALGCEVHDEHPAFATSRYEPPKKRMSAQLFSVRLDGCAVGVRLDKTGERALKPWRILTSDARMARALDRQCDGRHAHGHLRGDDALRSGFYPLPMVRLIADVVMKAEEWAQAVSEDLWMLPVDGRDDEEMPPPEPEAAPPPPAPGQPMAGVPEDARQRDLLIRRLHQNLNHPAPEVLVRMLRRHGARPEVLEAARAFRCAVCESNTRPRARPAAGSHTTAPPTLLLYADGMDWQRPRSRERHKVLVVLDDGSDVLAAYVMKSNLDGGSPGNFDHRQVQSVLTERWFQTYGYPDVLHLDPEGAFMAKDFARWAQSLGIEVDVIPAEAHWQQSRVERKIALLRDAADKLAEEVPDDVSASEILARCCAAANELERHGGFSPFQRMLGRSPRTGAILARDGNNLPLLDAESTPGHPLALNLEMQRRAQVAWLNAQASGRLRRAALARHRRQRLWEVGTAVYYWRAEDRPGSRTVQRGRWYGPGRVLATEGTRAGTHPERAGSTVWLVVAGRLVRCSPEQLREASASEIAADAAAHGGFPGPQGWTFGGVFDEVDNTQYLDLRQGGPPPEEEWFPEPETGVPTDHRAPGRPLDQRPESGAEHQDPPRGPGPDAAPHPAEPPPEGPRGRSRTPPTARPRSDDNDVPDPVAPARTRHRSKGPPRPGDRDLHGARDRSRSPPGRSTPGAASSGPRAPGPNPASSSTAATPPADPAPGPGAPTDDPASFRERRRAHEAAETQSFRRPVPAGGLRQAAERRDEAQDPDGWHRQVRPRLDDDETHLLAASYDDYDGDEDDVPGDLPDFAKEAEQYVYIAFDLRGRYEFDSFERDPAAFVASAARKSRVEVSLRKCTPEQQEAFRQAKLKEIGEWMRSGALRAICRKGIPLSRLMRSRWVLTFKESGAAKARLVLMGFTDPDLLHMRADSPTVSRRGRMMFLQLCANEGWRCEKGDVIGAFLQGRDETEALRAVYTDPVPELREAMGMKDTEIAQIVKAGYGLTCAPRRWWEQVKTDLKALGLTAIRTEP